MTKFKVKINQYVEEVAEIEVEAESNLSAQRKATDNPEDYDPDWADGNDIISGRVLEIKPAE